MKWRETLKFQYLFLTQKVLVKKYISTGKNYQSKFLVFKVASIVEKH